MDVTPLSLFLLFGLTARAIRLAVADDIADPARAATIRGAARLGRRWGDWAVSLVGCPFCIGFWISVASALAFLWWRDTLVWQVIALAGTLSYVAGHLVARLDLGD